MLKKTIPLFFLVMLFSASVSAEVNYGSSSAGGSSSINLLDDIDLSFGTGAPLKCRWETADANANALVCVFPEGGATDVPGFIIGDVTVDGTDLGFFNGETDPFLAVISDDGAGWGELSVDSTSFRIDTDATRIVKAVNGFSTSSISQTGLTTWTGSSTGVIQGNQYQCGRNSDTPNIIQCNVPTSSSFEFSVNDVAEFTLDASTANFQDNAITTTATNAAGGSKNSINISPSLGIMDGSDTYNALNIGITSAVHTGASNIVNGVNISGLTALGAATETALKIGNGWEVGIDNGSNTLVSTGTSVMRTIITDGAYTTSSTINSTNTNAAGGSANPIDITSTLGIMNGSDDYTAIDINLTNANHTGASNTIQGIDISNLTFDADQTATAINIGTGWNSGLTVPTNIPITLGSSSIAYDGTSLSLSATSTAITGTLTGQGNSLGWSIVTGANTACTTTCTSACVHGWDTAVTEVAVDCSDATADKCLCAGPN